MPFETSPMLLIVVLVVVVFVTILAVVSRFKRCPSDLSSTYKCNFLGADNKQ